MSGNRLIISNKCLLEMKIRTSYYVTKSHVTFEMPFLTTLVLMIYVEEVAKDPKLLKIII